MSYHQMGAESQKARGEDPLWKIQSDCRRLLRKHTLDGTRIRESDYFPQRRSAQPLRAEHDKSQQWSACATDDDLSTVSLSAVRMACRVQIARSRGCYRKSTDAYRSPRWVRGPHTRRLYLLWLNILLVPTRIRYKLRCISKDSCA